ncbi:MAG: acetyl-CoA carboxylase biotin carboxylase subunit [Acidobacteria bacterium]|nr:acetyl-CoA carboxylase biotin carboxylase subunit [Acidobacteriota bacterium]
MFKKILVANRGEIAVRVMRTCREMDISTVAVFSAVDRGALHVLYADEAYPIGPAAATESYLKIDRILEVAKRSGAEAVHPGYGFLAEKADFAEACGKAGLVFIGPSPEAMRLMGSKTASRRTLSKAKIPIVPGTYESLDTFEQIAEAADQVGYPLMLKATAGGGGKGMRMLTSAEELESAYRTARSEAVNAFNDPGLYIEKYIPRPRHIEIQILGDHHGNLVSLGERECSLQRRHQKVMEEAPSPIVDEPMRRAMGKAAVRVAKLAGYTNAGTVEFLVDADRNFYFLEMNARLQVEHPVTEMVIGLDLVKEQIRIAAGEKLSLRKKDLHPRGAAIECRLYAEDPANRFFPSPGLIRRLSVPSGPGIREDSGVYEGWRVPLDYDPLLSKLIAWGRTRAEAISRLERALAEYHLDGIKTNLPFFRKVLKEPDFLSGNIDTHFVDALLEKYSEQVEEAEPEQETAALLAACLQAWRSKNSTSTPTPKTQASRWKISGRLAQLRGAVPGRPKFPS